MASSRGLLLSSLVKTSERAMTILPLILMPQIMLAGLIAKVSNGFVEFISYLTISRWGVEGFNIIQENIIQPIATINGEVIAQKIDARDTLLNQFHKDYRIGYIFGDITGTLMLDFYAIILMTLIMIFFIYKTLKNKTTISIK